MIAGAHRWRLLLVASGALIIAGGMQHPRDGDMAQMLADPVWVLSHSLLLAGLVALLAGLVLLRRESVLGSRSRRWARFAVWVTAAEMVEMAVHTVAVVDAENLASGASTPVFTTHMTLAMIIYPIFGLVMAGFVVATARDRALASRWVAPLGVIGALAHSFALPLVSLGIPWAGILFPMLIVFALWLVLCGIWPGGRRSAVASAA